MSWLGLDRLAKRRRSTRRARARRAAKRGPEQRGPTRSRAGFGSLALRLGALTVVWLAASATILYRRNAPVFDYVVGQLADRNIYSEVDFEYEDQQETQRLRNAQRNQTPPVYRVDRYTLDLSLSYLDELRKAVTSRAAALEPAADGTAGDSGLPPPPVAAFLEGAGDEEILELHGLFSDSAFWRLLTDATRQTLQLGVAAEPGNLSHAGDPPVGGQVSLMDDQGRRAVREAAGFADPTRAAARIVDRVVPNVEPQAQPLLRGLQDVLGEIVQPNLVCDRRLTDTVRRLAAEQVTPAKTVVRANILLLRAGSRVTPEDLTRLSEHQKEFQRRRQQSDTTIETLGVVLLVLVLMVFACAAFHLMREAVIHHTGYALLLAGAIVLQLFLTRVVGDLYYRYWLSSILLFPLLPLSFCSMLAAQLLGVRAAITAGLVVSGIASLQYGRSLELLLIGTLSSFVAAVAIREARRRFHIFRAGVSVGLTVFLVNALLRLANQLPWETQLAMFGLAMLNGFAVAVVVAVVLPFFEFLFGTTSDLSLLELSDFNHPLLRRLQLEAPGTYHHSLMVATLAEQAAEAVNANPLLARVCAYFHDIGKLAHPEYFIENLAGVNPHDELQPRMSSLVILNHVKEGIVLAEEFKLKRVIRDVIAEHHGTSLVYYFYRRALDHCEDNGNGRRVGEGDYRYPGPRPTGKESAIISLADPCEAASRSLIKPTPQKIRALVDDIVRRRVEDGQLDDAKLTLRELSVVRATIAKTLSTMLHGRIRYPKDRQDADRTGDASRGGAVAAPDAAPPGPGTGREPDASGTG